MYELSEQDSEFLKLTGSQVLYINMLLKHAYQNGSCDAINAFKSVISK